MDLFGYLGASNEGTLGKESFLKGFWAKIVFISSQSKVVAVISDPLYDEVMDALHYQHSQSIYKYTYICNH